MLCANDAQLFAPETQSALVERLRDFASAYNAIHPLICLALCPLGIVANIVHILILSQRRMRHAPVNACLIGVALCDVLTMASYFVYIFRFEVLTRYFGVTGISYFWATVLRFHATSSIALHTITLYTIVVMALIRWRTMCQRTYSDRTLTPAFAWKCFALISVCVALLCLPTFLVHDVVKLPSAQSTEAQSIQQMAEFYTVDISKWALRNDCRWFKANLFIIGVGLKAVPCFLMLWFSLALMLLLHRNNAKRALLLFNKNSRGKGARKGPGTGYDRTTFTLIVMLSAFLLTEMPQGILATLNGVYTNEVHVIFYMHLANVLDLLSLINCYVAFATYAVLCTKYRQTFVALIAQWSSRLFPRSFSLLSMGGSGGPDKRRRTNDSEGMSARNGGYSGIHSNNNGGGCGGSGERRETLLLLPPNTTTMSQITMDEMISTILC